MPTAQHVQYANVIKESPVARYLKQIFFAGNNWSSKWRGLKDTYNKFKKNSETSSCHSYKKYKKWPWTEQSRFLDDFNDRRTCGSNSDISSDLTQEVGHTSSQSSVADNLYSAVDDLQDLVQEATQNVAPESKKRKMKNRAETTDRVLEYLKMRCDQKSRLDRVDYFFLSYAQTFKKFPKSMQSMLKLELTSLFTRYELQAEGVPNAKIPRLVHQIDFSSTSEDAWASPLSVSSNDFKRPRTAMSDLTTSKAIARIMPNTAQDEIPSTSQVISNSTQRDNSGTSHPPLVSFSDLDRPRSTMLKLNNPIVSAPSAIANINVPISSTLKMTLPVQTMDLSNRSQESSALIFTNYYETRPNSFDSYCETDTD